MKQHEENYLSMARAVKETLNTHAEQWAKMPRFVAAKELLDTQVASVDELYAQSSINTKGATQDKMNAEMEAVLLALELCDRAQVYAKDNGNKLLWEQLSFSLSDLTDGTDSQTLALLRDIYTRLRGIIGDLNAYGVPDSELQSLKTKTDAFEEDMAIPRDLTVKRKGFKQSIPAVLRDMRENFLVLDRLITMWKGSRLEQDYWNARIIVDLGSRKEKGDASPTS